MIKSLHVTAFKSLERIGIELGQINVFIGANGSGKSNLLEATGVLSAAASGRVDDESLIRRGVRPGVPRLYKCALIDTPQANAISFTADTVESSYSVSLLNPIKDPKPAWRYNTERWTLGDETIVGRSNRSRDKINSEAGLAALKAVERIETDPALQLLNILRNYSIYSPNTPTLRGLISDPQTRDPLGLSGGNLPQGLQSLLKQIKIDKVKEEEFERAKELIDWAKDVDPVSSTAIPLSPSLSTSKQIIKFVDRYMVKERNAISGADASEGALYILFMAILALDDKTPKFMAVDNADHGLNPRLAKALMSLFTHWVINNPIKKQFMLTTHNPLVLDGLPLKDDRVKLFAVDRTKSGRTVINPIKMDEKLVSKLQKNNSLSRLWVMGHLGGIPNV